jgi:HK97 family phage prohead protease
MEKETRTFSTIYKRQEEGRGVRGMAAIYNSRADLGWFEEEIVPGAFDNAIDVSDARALFNHDPNYLLARQSSGTLRLELRDGGLEYDFESPNTTAGNDLIELINRGDVKESSFAFTIAPDGQEWKQETRGNKTIDVRYITKIERLFDVSPVTYPAYKDATVGKRTWDLRQEEVKKIEESKEENDQEAVKRSARLREVNLLIKKDLI